MEKRITKAEWAVLVGLVAISLTLAWMYWSTVWRDHQRVNTLWSERHP